MPRRCPGTHQLPTRTTRYNMPTQYNMAVHPDSGWCPACGREYVLNDDGTIRAHRGLPKPPDGGCPYRCPGPECDFACYFEQAS